MLTTDCMYTVYVLQNKIGEIYIGQTDNIQKRLGQHNDLNFNRRSYTKLHQGPWTLVYQETVPSRNEALLREKRLKSHKGRDWIRSTFNLGP